MDEQNPRVGAERIGGRGDEWATGRERSTTASPAAESAQPRTRRRSTGSRVAGQETADTPPEQRTREIRAEIDQTREEMSETVNAIQARLSPGNIAAKAADSVKSAAREKARDVVESDSVQYVRANPIPTAMIGIGIAGLTWLALRGRGTRAAYRPAPRWSGTQATSFELDEETRGGEYGSAFDGPMRDATDYGFERTTPRPSQVVSRARGRVQRTWNENPLVIGAASAAVGALVALALPETDRENQLMGETRDSIVETVQDTVRDKVNQVQEAATSAVGKVQEAATNAVGLSESAGADRSNS